MAVRERPWPRTKAGDVVASGGLSDADFDELFRGSWLSLVRLSRLLVAEVSLAEDVVQDAFAALYRRRDRMRDVAGARSYLRVSVVNGSRSALRRRRVASLALRSHRFDDDVAGADQQALANAGTTAVLSLLHTLPLRQREVLILRYFLDLPERDIAQTLGISQGTVKSSAARGLKSLKATLGEY